MFGKKIQYDKLAQSQAQTCAWQALSNYVYHEESEGLGLILDFLVK